MTSSLAFEFGRRMRRWAVEAAIGPCGFMGFGRDGGGKPHRVGVESRVLWIARHESDPSPCQKVLVL